MLFEDSMSLSIVSLLSNWAHILIYQFKKWRELLNFEISPESNNVKNITTSTHKP